MQGIDVELWQCSGAWGEKLPAAVEALGYSSLPTHLLVLDRT